MVADNKAGEEPQDRRIAWIEQRFNAATKLRPQELRKLFDSEDYKAVLMEFLDVPERMSVFIVGLPTGSYAVVNNDTDTSQMKSVEFRKKVFYFRKNKKEKILDDKVMNTSVSYGDVNVDFLQSFHDFANGVVMPLLKNPANVKGRVPDVKYAQLLDETHELLAQSLMTLGRHHELTLLPIPSLKLPARITVESATADTTLVYQLESSVALWSELIKQAIAATPESLPTFLGRPAGPLDEVAFWKSKAANIAQLEEQLCKPFIAKATVLLKFAESNSYPAFNALSYELHDSLAEATEISRYLTPLTEILEEISPRSSNHVSLNDLVEQRTFRKLFQLLYVIWTSCDRFATTARMVHFMSLIVNDVIENAREAITVADVFQPDTEEVIKTITAVLSGCGEFKSAFFFFKAKSATELQRPWRFQNAALFANLDLFLERSHDLLDLIETATLFYKLPNVKLGGATGLHTSVEVEELQQAYLAAQGELSALEYDFLDVHDHRFETDYDTFRTKVRGLEERLASIMSSALTGTSALSDTFKVVDTFDGFTARPVVHQEWASKQQEVLKAWYDELLAAQADFIQNRADPPAVPNMPATSTATHWANSLLHRINASHARIMELAKPVLHSELGDTAQRLHESLRNNIRAFMYSTYEAWASTVGQISHDKLQCFVLQQHPTEANKYVVNFDPHLSRTLREVSHIERIAQEHEDAFVIPPQVVALYKQRDTLRNHILRLEYVCTTVNRLEDTLLPCERALIDKELDQLAMDLQRGAGDVQWSSGDVCARYVHEITSEVVQLERATAALQNNLTRCCELFGELLQEDKFLPLSASKSDARVLTETDFTKKLVEHTQVREQRMATIDTRVAELLNASLVSLNELKGQVALAHVTEDAPTWQDYLTHAAGEVGEALINSLCGSLTHLRNQCDSQWLHQHGGMPLLEIKLQITKAREAANEAAKVQFEPSLTQQSGASAVATFSGSLGGSAARSASTSLLSLITDAALSVFGLARKVRLPNRDSLGREECHDYSDIMNRSADARGLLAEIESLVRETAQRGEDYRVKFAQYGFLYETNMQRQFRQFLVEHGGGAAAVGAAGGDGEGDGEEAEDQPPAKQQQQQQSQQQDQQQQQATAGDVPTHYFGVPLEVIDVEIRRFEELEDELDGLPSTAVVAFVRVDSKPLRHGLLDLCVRWRNLFTNYLTSKITADLKDLYEFMKKTEADLRAEVVEGDIESLKRVMRCVRHCRRRNDQVQAMMEPISRAALLLKQHPLAVTERTLEEIEELRKPALDAWGVLYRACLNVREQHSKAQDREAENVKEETAKFEECLVVAGSELRSASLYSYTHAPATAYEDVDEWAQRAVALETQARALWDLQELFDLTPTDFRELTGDPVGAGDAQAPVGLGEPCHAAVQAVDDSPVQHSRRRRLPRRN
jgi:dynein heavy chain